DALDARDVVDGLEQAGKITTWIVRSLIVVDDLPQKLHFPAPTLCRVVHFGDDIGFGSHALVAPRVRHDAEAAEFVAPLDDRDVRLDRITAARHAQRPR